MFTHEHHTGGKRHHRGPEGAHGAAGRRGGRGHGGRRHGRGDVRIALLVLLGEGPMHGYQLMQTVAERTAGAWKPSPGAVYPTLSQLEDEGLVVVTLDGGRKLAALTEAGRAHVAEHGADWPDPFERARVAGPNLRELVGELADAARQVGRSGDEQQVQAAADVLSQARRDLYLILAGESKA